RECSVRKPLGRILTGEAGDVITDLGETAVPGGDHRHSARRGFKKRESEAFFRRGQNDSAAGADRGDQFIVRQVRQSDRAAAVDVSRETNYFLFRVMVGVADNFGDASHPLRALTFNSRGDVQYIDGL